MSESNGEQSRYDAEPAAAYVRATLLVTPTEETESALIERGRVARLNLVRFKRTIELARVRCVLGVLHSLGPESLLDLGAGRETFLWPLLDEFPALRVTAFEASPAESSVLEAVHHGRLDELAIRRCDAAHLDITDRAFDVVTDPEVLEHQDDPRPIAATAMRMPVVVSSPRFFHGMTTTPSTCNCSQRSRCHSSCATPALPRSGSFRSRIIWSPSQALEFDHDRTARRRTAEEGKAARP